ncbi:MAG TPA: hypothetical protein VIL29_07465 [Pseudothermotoga sp.]
MGVVGVYNEKVKSEERLYFKLEEWNDDEVIIKIVDKNGVDINAPFICTINNKTGEIKREPDVNNMIGFELDEKGRVKVV